MEFISVDCKLLIISCKARPLDTRISKPLLRPRTSSAPGGSRDEDMEAKEEEEAAEEAAAAFDPEGSYLVPPAQPSYQAKLSSTPSFYPNNYPSSASSLWMHRGRNLGNTPVAIQGNPSAARQTFTA